MKFLKVLFTDGTNRDYDYARVMGAVAIIVFLSLSIYDYGFRKSNWDPLNWSSAFAVIIGASTGISKLKDFTAPKDTQ